jgi:hypothetical protein
VGVVDPASETWYLRNENSAGIADVHRAFQYGLPGWKPVAGDWTANGRTGIGVFSGAWYLRTTASAGFPDIAPFPFGLGGWTPVPSQWSFPMTSVIAADGARAAGPDRGAFGPSGLATAVNGLLARLGVTGLRRTQALDHNFTADGL